MANAKGVRKAMRISNVDIMTISSQKNGLVGFANIVVNDILLTSIAIYRKKSGGYRLLYPTKRAGENEKVIYHPISKTASKTIESAIFAEYKKVIGKGCDNDRYHKVGVRD